MSRIGLKIGLAMVVLLLALATPVMANNVILNPNGLYLYDFKVTPESGRAPLTIYINVSLNNTNDTASSLYGYIVLWVNGNHVDISQQTLSYGGNVSSANVEFITIGSTPVQVINVTVANNTVGDDLGWVNFTYTFQYTGYYLVSVGNDTVTLVPKTVTVYPLIELIPEYGVVGTTVEVKGYRFSSNSPVTVYFSTPTGDVIVNNTVSTDSGGNFTATFKVPDVPVGPRTVKAVDSNGLDAEAQFTVLPVPVEKTLADLGITELKLNKTVLRYRDHVRMDVAVNETKITQNNEVYIAIINESAWNNIYENYINAGKYVDWFIIASNASEWWYVTTNGLIKIFTLSPNDYYVVVYNVTPWSPQSVYMYNISATLTVKPSPTPVDLSKLGINEAWSVKNGMLNVSNVVYGETIKIPINATQPVNIAIVESSTWDKLYANRSTLTKNDVFSNAKWYKEDFVNNKNETLEVSTTDYGITPGTYRIVVFNTTDDYIYYYNNSTMFNVTPVPTATTLDKLGVEQLTINRTEMGWDETLKLMVYRSVNTNISVVILNETAWNNIVENFIEKKKPVENAMIMSNAIPPYGWNKTSNSDFFAYVSGLLPNKYKVIVYNTTKIGDTEYVNLYNVSGTFEVYLKPKKVNMSDLNVTVSIDKNVVDYGQTIKLTVNVTGNTNNVNIAILNVSAWNELLAQSGIENETIIEESRWNLTNVNDNGTKDIETLNKLLPNEYVVVVYNTTDVQNVPYVNWYNDDIRFTVKTTTEKVDLKDLGIETVVLNTTKAIYGGGIRIAIGYNESFGKPVNMIITNETNWTYIIESAPSNDTAWSMSVYNTTISEDQVITRTVDYPPDTYVVAFYLEENGAITKYNDDIKFSVVYKSTKVNLTDLVRVLSVTPDQVEAGETVTLELGHKVNVSVAILPNTTWNSIKSEETILNKTLLDNSVWKLINVTCDVVKPISTTGWPAGTYVVVVYNTSQDFTEYVNWYNDSVTFKVVAPTAPDLTVESITVTPEEPVVNETITITAKIANVGNADAGAFNVSLYVNNSSIETKMIESLKAGNDTTVSFSWTPTKAGNYTLKVVVDPDNKVSESNEANNEMTKPVTILEKPVSIVDRYDKNHDGKISNDEFINAFDDWMHNTITMDEFIEVFDAWMSS